MKTVASIRPAALGQTLALHPALRRLWAQSLLGFWRWIGALAFSAWGAIVLLPIAVVFAALLHDNLAREAPWITQFVDANLLTLLTLAAPTLSLGFTTSSTQTYAPLLLAPISRKQILFYVLLRRVTFLAGISALAALVLDPRHFLDLTLRLAALATLATSTLMLVDHSLEKASARTRLSVEILTWLPLFAAVTAIASFAFFKLAGARASALALKEAFLTLHAYLPFRYLAAGIHAPGWSGALVLAAACLAGAALATFLLLHFHEALSEPPQRAALPVRLLAKNSTVRTLPLPAFPRWGGLGPVLRMQLIAAANRGSLLLPLLLTSLVPQLSMLTAKKEGLALRPVGLSFLMIISVYVAVLFLVALKKDFFGHLERYKALPITPFALLGGNLVLTLLATLFFAGLSLIPSLLLFPAATWALPLGRFFLVLVPLTLFVTAATQATVLTMHQQFQRISMAKHWYWEIAYGASLILAFLVSVLLLFAITAPALAWNEVSLSTALVIGSIQLAGTALMFWYARVSYRLTEVLHHNG